MEDFDGLASTLALGVAEVRGCLILSRDGLVLGSHPAGVEAAVTPAWLRFAALGDPERGFVQFGSETWCCVRRGPYAAFAVVGVGARPGLVIDHMEQVLLAAEEARSRREGVRGADPVPGAAPASKPRTPLHPEPRSGDVPVVLPPATPTTIARGRGGAPEAPDGDADGARRPPDPESETAADEHGEVDRFSLAREFGRLLQHDEEGADG